MSLQVFLQAQLLGAEDFLVSQSFGQKDPIASLAGRCAWLNLLCEVVPRALLAELKLSVMLLGSSSAEQFLLVLAEEDIPRANEFLDRAANAISELSGRMLRLVWAATENLGAWPVVRKRLEDALLSKTSAPLANQSDAAALFTPFNGRPESGDHSYFASFGEQLASASRIGWFADRPAHLAWDEGQYFWPLKDQSGPGDDGILFPRRFALDDTGTRPASLLELAERAEGAPRWGILQGDVDQFELALRRAGSIEEHIHLSVLFKEFFAGELALLCTLPDFWRKVTILYRGGDGFIVVGAWDSLVAMAREIERLFEKFAEQNAHSLPGVEAKTISMALAIASENTTPVEIVSKQVITELRAAKAIEPGTFFLFGRALEWKRLSDAEELKTSLVRLVKDFNYSPDSIHDLASIYREAYSSRAARKEKAVRIEKPWRTYMRVSRVLPQARGKEATLVRNAVMSSLAGKKTAGIKLRPPARVGLEWARLAAAVM